MEYNNQLKGKKHQPTSHLGKAHAKDVRTLSLEDNRDKSIVQRKLFNDCFKLTSAHPTIQNKTNNTGIPERLKTGVESLSGISMDDVKVHYNSARPAQLNAFAYAQGTDIHIAPGQEKHLPHEAWHVAQQKQGRVKPTMQMKERIFVNSDKSLEDEADLMGNRALNGPLQRQRYVHTDPVKYNTDLIDDGQVAFDKRSQIVQRKVGFEVEIANPYSRVKRTANLAAGMDEKSTKGLTPLKGAHIMTGYGWNMTPDGGGSNWKKWWVEFISDPVDETTSPGALAHFTEDLVVYIGAAASRGNDEIVMETKYKRLDYRDYSIYLDPENLYGQFQITGGVRLDKLMTLLEIIIGEGYIPGKVYGAPLLHAKKVGERKSKNADYNNLVALLGTYISGQYDDDEAPSSAKHKIPVLSKTNLGEVFKAMDFRPDLDRFVADVIEASGIDGLDGDARLFMQGITGNAHRGIDQVPDITIKGWLTGIYKEHDVKWADNEYAMEDVGPDHNKTGRAKGLVVELRSLLDKDPRGMYYKEWPKYVQALSDIFKIVNESKK